MGETLPGGQVPRSPGAMPTNLHSRPKSANSRAEARPSSATSIGAFAADLLRGSPPEEAITRLNVRLDAIGIGVAQIQLLEGPEGQPRRFRPKTVLRFPFQEERNLYLGRRRVGVATVGLRSLSPAFEQLGPVISAIGESLLASLYRDAGQPVTRPVPADLRSEIGYDLHDGPGQLLVAMHLLACNAEERAPEGSAWHDEAARIASLAELAKRELDQIVGGLVTAPVEGRDLWNAIGELARGFEADSGIRINLKLEGCLRQLPTGIEQALHRVTQQALVNAWRHARCAAVRLHLAFEPSSVTMRIRDDGVGLGRRVEGRGPAFGLRSMRRAMDEVGGTFVVRSAGGRGVMIEARVAVSGV